VAIYLTRSAPSVSQSQAFQPCWELDTPLSFPVRPDNGEFSNGSALTGSCLSACLPVTGRAELVGTGSSKDDAASLASSRCQTLHCLRQMPPAGPGSCHWCVREPDTKSRSGKSATITLLQATSVEPPDHWPKELRFRTGMARCVFQSVFFGAFGSDRATGASPDPYQAHRPKLRSRLSRS